VGFGKSSERIETNHPPGVVVRLKDGRTLGPRHQATAGKDSTLDNASVHTQVQFENLITHQKTCQVLPANMAREGFEPLRKRDAGVLERFAKVLNNTLFLGEMHPGMMTELT
jgi:hypothetical protein